MASRPLQAGAHRIGRELAGRGDLVVAEARGFAQQEHVALDRRQPLERLAPRRRAPLRRRAGAVGRIRRSGRRRPSRAWLSASWRNLNTQARSAGGSASGTGDRATRRNTSWSGREPVGLADAPAQILEHFVPCTARTRHRPSPSRSLIRTPPRGILSRGSGSVGSGIGDRDREAIGDQDRGPRGRREEETSRAGPDRERARPPEQNDGDPRGGREPDER